MQGGRKVQAWLYDGLNKGLLAGRIQALMLMSGLLEDWYFSWGLLRTEGSLQDVLMELVKVPLPRGVALARMSSWRCARTWMLNLPTVDFN